MYDILYMLLNTYETTYHYDAFNTYGVISIHVFIESTYYSIHLPFHYLWWKLGSLGGLRFDGLLPTLWTYVWEEGGTHTHTYLAFGFRLCFI